MTTDKKNFSAVFWDESGTVNEIDYYNQLTVKQAIARAKKELPNKVITAFFEEVPAASVTLWDDDAEEVAEITNCEVVIL